MDQGVRYVVTLQDINVVSGLKSMESSATSAEHSIASLNDTLRSLVGAVGLDLGLRTLFNFGKDAVQGAADYETAVKRIKFASEDFAQGAINNAFISSEADKFKIGLQGATEAYGKFLAMLSGSGIASDQIRALHDELLTIGKVKGLGDGQLDAAVMNLGKMLESGSLDARHFRPLEQQLSGIGAFVAKELGISVHQLAVLRNKGKMSQIDPRVLLNAIEKQAASLEKFLPESTTTIQSQINDLDNAWLRFKNDLVFDNIGELKYLFDTLKSGVGYLKEHEQQIISFGRTVITLGQIWLGYKVALATVNGLEAIRVGYLSGRLAQEELQAAAITKQTAAYGMQASAVNTLTAAIERLNFVQNAQNGSFVTNAAGMTMANTTGNRYILAQEERLIAQEAKEAGVLAGTTVATSLGATIVSILPWAVGALLVGYGINKLGDHIGAEGRKDFNRDYEMVTDPNDPRVFKPRPQVNEKGETETVDRGRVAGALGVVNATTPGLVPQMGVEKSFGKFKPAGEKKITEKISPPTDKITGQRVISYNIQIKEINGIKQNTVNEGGKMETQNVAEALRDIIISVVSDSQLRAGN